MQRATEGRNPAHAPDRRGLAVKAALIGEGIALSLTPGMHEAEAAAQGFAYRYTRFDTALAPFDQMTLAELLQLAEERGLAGVNVTHPFKTEAVALMDTLSDTARDLGAVNTVVFQGGRRIGHNTDYTGFLYAFNAGLGGAKRNRVLLLGAGGGGAAVALALLDARVKYLKIADPAPGRAEALRARLLPLRPGAKVTATSAPEALELAGFDGVVNATPMGMLAHPGVAIDPGALPPGAWVADIVYFPLETEFLQAARRKGCQTMSGAGMAVHQAVAAFGLITGREADPRRMAASFEPLLQARALNSR